MDTWCAKKWGRNLGILMVECHKCGKIHMKLVNVAGIHMGLSENLVEHHQNTSNISNVDR